MHDKLALLTDLYSFVLDNTESFEEEHIGADLAYLMGAILKGENCLWPKSRPILRVLEEGLDRASVALAMQHIHIDCVERCDCRGCRPELYV